MADSRCQEPLASIGRMCDAGNVAIFTKHGGYIVPQSSIQGTIDSIEKSKRPTVRMRRDNGVYNFTMRVPRGADKVQPAVATIVHRNRWQDLVVAEEEKGDDNNDNPRYNQDFPRLGVELF